MLFAVHAKEVKMSMLNAILVAGSYRLRFRHAGCSKNEAKQSKNKEIHTNPWSRFGHDLVTLGHAGCSKNQAKQRKSTQIHANPCKTKQIHTNA